MINFDLMMLPKELQINIIEIDYKFLIIHTKC